MNAWDASDAVRPDAMADAALPERLAADAGKLAGPARDAPEPDVPIQ